MSNTKYALRANVFGYNDEYYNIYDLGDDGRICGLYETREEAMDAWKNMEYQLIKDRPLENVLNHIGESSEENWPEEDLQTLDSFVFERCGEHIADGEYGQWWAYEELGTIIAKMTVEDVFEFLTKTKLRSYTLVEYQADIKFYVVWLPEQNAYFFEQTYFDFGGEYSLYRSIQEQDAVDKCLREVYTAQFTGALNELSHSPEILRTLIATNPKIQYDEAQHVLSLQDASVFKEVYPLLIKPPFEVREVTLEQMIEIEKDLPENLY